MSMVKKELSNGSPASLNTVLRGGIYSFVVSIILSVILGLVFYFSNISESVISTLATGVMAVSVLLGSAVALRQVGSRALLHGLAIGVFFFLIVLVLSAFLLPGGIDLKVILAKFALITVAGMLGGILGVSTT